jgi:coenzyme F420-reducing hydrogenase gamma subunit
MSSYATCTGYVWPCDKCGVLCRSASGLCEECLTKEKKCIECGKKFITKKDGRYCPEHENRRNREIAGDEWVYN